MLGNILGAVAGAGASKLFGGGGKTVTQPVVTPFESLPAFAQDFIKEQYQPQMEAAFAQPFMPVPTDRIAYDGGGGLFGNPELGALQMFMDMNAAAAPQQPMPAPVPDMTGLDMALGRLALGQPDPYRNTMQAENFALMGDDYLTALGRSMQMQPENKSPFNRPGRFSEDQMRQILAGLALPEGNTMLFGYNTDYLRGLM